MCACVCKDRCVGDGAVEILQYVVGVPLFVHELDRIFLHSDVLPWM